jgi:hypothetical protein
MPPLSSAAGNGPTEVRTPRKRLQNAGRSSEVTQKRAHTASHRIRARLTLFSISIQLQGSAFHRLPCPTDTLSRDRRGTSLAALACLNSWRGKRLALRRGRASLSIEPVSHKVDARRRQRRRPSRRETAPALLKPPKRSLTPEHCGDRIPPVSRPCAKVRRRKVKAPQRHARSRRGVGFLRKGLAIMMIRG